MKEIEKRQTQNLCSVHAKCAKREQGTQEIYCDSDICLLRFSLYVVLMDNENPGTSESFNTKAK